MEEISNDILKEFEEYQLSLLNSKMDETKVAHMRTAIYYCGQMVKKIVEEKNRKYKFKKNKNKWNRKYVINIRLGLTGGRL